MAAKKIKVEWNTEEWYPVYVPKTSFQKDNHGQPMKYEVPEELWNKYVTAYNVFRPLLEQLCESQDDFLR